MTISCEHVIANSSPVTWIINGTSFSQEQIFFSPSYQQYRQTTPTENSLTVFSINHTTTFQCVVHSIPVTTSTLGTINVIGMYAYAYVNRYIYTYISVYACYVHYIFRYVELSTYVQLILL